MLELSCQHKDRPQPHEVYTIGTHRKIKLCSKFRDEWLRGPNEIKKKPRPTNDRA